VPHDVQVRRVREAQDALALGAAVVGASLGRRDVEVGRLPRGAEVACHGRRRCGEGQRKVAHCDGRLGAVVPHRSRWVVVESSAGV